MKVMYVKLTHYNMRVKMCLKWFILWVFRETEYISKNILRPGVLQIHAYLSQIKIFKSLNSACTA